MLLDMMLEHHLRGTNPRIESRELSWRLRSIRSWLHQVNGEGTEELAAGELDKLLERHLRGTNPHIESHELSWRLRSIKSRLHRVTGELAEELAAGELDQLHTEVQSLEAQRAGREVENVPLRDLARDLVGEIEQLSSVDAQPKPDARGSLSGVAQAVDEPVGVGALVIDVGTGELKLMAALRFARVEMIELVEVEMSNVAPGATSTTVFAGPGEPQKMTGFTVIASALRKGVDAVVCTPWCPALPHPAPVHPSPAQLGRRQ